MGYVIYFRVKGIYPEETVGITPIEINITIGHKYFITIQRVIHAPLSREAKFFSNDCQVQILADQSLP